MLCHPRATHEFLKKIWPFGPAVWPAIGNIYTNFLFYRIIISIYIYIRFQAGKVLLLMSVASWVLFTLPIGFIHPPVVSCKHNNGSHYLLKDPRYRFTTLQVSILARNLRKSILMKPGFLNGLSIFVETNIFVKKYHFIWFLYIIFLFSDF